MTHDLTTALLSISQSPEDRGSISSLTIMSIWPRKTSLNPLKIGAALVHQQTPHRAYPLKIGISSSSPTLRAAFVLQNNLVRQMGVFCLNPLKIGEALVHYDLPEADKEDRGGISSLRGPKSLVRPNDCKQR
jgi:hypothetical protein